MYFGSHQCFGSFRDIPFLSLRHVGSTVGGVAVWYRSGSGVHLWDSVGIPCCWMAFGACIWHCGSIAFCTFSEKGDLRRDGIVSGMKTNHNFKHSRVLDFDFVTRCCGMSSEWSAPREDDRLDDALCSHPLSLVNTTQYHLAATRSSQSCYVLQPRFGYACRPKTEHGQTSRSTAHRPPC